MGARFGPGDMPNGANESVGHGGSSGNVWAWARRKVTAALKPRTPAIPDDAVAVG